MKLFFPVHLEQQSETLVQEMIASFNSSYFLMQKKLTESGYSIPFDITLAVMESMREIEKTLLENIKKEKDYESKD